MTADVPRPGAFRAARSRSVVVCALGLAVSLVLSGFGLMNQLEASKPAPAATTTAEPVADPKSVVTSPQLEPGTVVATGRLGGDPLIAGEVEIRAVQNGFELRSLNFIMTHGGDISVAVSPRRVEPGTKCTSSTMTLSWGSPFEYADFIFPLQDDGYTDGDLSFLRSVLIEIYDEVAFAQGCYISVFCRARFSTGHCRTCNPAWSWSTPEKPEARTVG